MITIKLKIYDWNIFFVEFNLCDFLFDKTHELSDVNLYSWKMLFRGKELLVKMLLVRHKTGMTVNLYCIIMIKLWMRLNVLWQIMHLYDENEYLYSVMVWLRLLME